MEEIFQDSEQMAAIASDIEKDAQDLGRLVEEMYTLLDQKLGAEDDGQKVWFGPKASVFLQNIKNKRVDFENAQQNINTLGQNLQAHADTWNSFENA